MKKMYRKAISDLLYAANTCPPPICRDRFYAMKDAILKRYGSNTGHVVQHIKKECWACDGTGIFHCDWKGDESCLKCSGTGLYSEVWVLLERWEFNGYSFLRPIHRTGSPDLTINKHSFGMVEGYIEHKAHRYNIEAQYLLALIFDPELFFAWWGYRRHSVKRAPWYYLAKRRVLQMLRLDTDDIPF